MVIRLDTIPEAADIPKNWIYHHYLKLKEPLDGRRIRIKSCFNSDSTPSMFLYVSNGEYRWKDFSSGLFGSSPYDLIQQIVYKETGERPEFKEVFTRYMGQHEILLVGHTDFTKAKSLCHVGDYFHLACCRITWWNPGSF